MRCYGLSTYVTDDFDDGVSLGSYVDGAIAEISFAACTPREVSGAPSSVIHCLFSGSVHRLSFLLRI